MAMSFLLTDRWMEAAKRVAAAPVFRFPWWIWALYALMLTAVAAVGATSYWMEAVRAGADMPLWRLFIEEGTSVVVVLALTPPLLVWVARLDPRRIGWSRVIAGHVAGIAVFTVLHIAGMRFLRWLAFSLAGHPDLVGTDPWLPTLVYEGRKDALTYAALTGGAWVVASLLKRAVRTPPVRIEIRDGARRTWVEIDHILWVEAAANYVEFNLRDRTLLRRQTLAAAERELDGLGFARIHRSRLVNRQHILAAESNDSGDFILTLTDGRKLSGSRRWRGVVETLFAPAGLSG